MAEHTCVIAKLDLNKRHNYGMDEKDWHDHLIFRNVHIHVIIPSNRECSEQNSRPHCIVIEIGIL